MEISIQKATHIIHDADIVDFEDCVYQNEADELLSNIVEDDTSLQACLVDQEDMNPYLGFHKPLLSQWIECKTS